MQISFRMGYLIILLLVMGVSFWLFSYAIPNNMVLYLNAVKDNFMDFPLRLNIILSLINLAPFTLGFIPIIPLIVPILIISGDFESRNFEVMCTTKFNSLGYHLGNVAFTFLTVFIVLLEVMYIGEGIIFYSGYSITSGFLIDPIFLAVIYMIILAVPISVGIFIATLVGNRALSLIIFLFLTIITFAIVTSLYGNGKTPIDDSWLNNFLLMLDPIPYLMQVPLTMHIINFSVFAHSAIDPGVGYLSLYNYFEGRALLDGYIPQILCESTFLFLSLGFLVLFLRKNIVLIAGYFTSFINGRRRKEEDLNEKN